MRHHNTEAPLFGKSGLHRSNGAFQRAECFPRLTANYYGNGPPHWTYGKKKEPAETAADAEHTRKRTVRRLRKFAALAGNADYADCCEQLAHLIEGCCPVGRCNSQACPLCRRALQRWFVFEAQAFTQGMHAAGAQAAVKQLPARKKSLAAISIIPTTRLRGGNDLIHTARKLREMKQELHEAIEQAIIPFAIGGIDVSYNTHPENAFRSHYQFHLWALAPYEAAQCGRARLHEFFPPTQKWQVSAWVSEKEFNGNSSGYAYALKTDFVKRCTVPAHVNGKGEIVRQNTRDKPMTIEEQCRLLVMIHMLGPAGRLFLHGAEVAASGQSRELVIRMSPIDENE